MKKLNTLLGWFFVIVLTLGFFATIGFAADSTFESKEGVPLTLTAEADGNPAPMYDWFKDGVKVATNVNPFLLKGDLTDSGLYHARAYNSAGEGLSNKIALTITPIVEAPVIVAQPTNQTVLQGRPVAFTVQATGKPAPTYQWRKNGVPIAGATSATYSIAGVAKTDSGDYTVVVTNSAGSVISASAKLDVQYAPVFLKPIIITGPRTVQTYQKGNATFTVQASGPDLQYQWYRGATPLWGENESTLRLTRVNPSYEGTYTVAVSNQYGSVSASAQLVVLR